MIAPTGQEIRVGQVWEEIGYARHVWVIGMDEQRQRVRIEGCRATSAKLSRFHGRVGGYRLIKDAP